MIRVVCICNNCARQKTLIVTEIMINRLVCAYCGNEHVVIKDVDKVENSIRIGEDTPIKSYGY